MKYQVSFLIVLTLVHLSCSSNRSVQSHQPTAPQAQDGSTFSLGMSHDAVLEIIRECGGQDITSGQAVIGPNGESPSNGVYWHLKQYDSVLAIGAENGKVNGIEYWTSADFSKSKSHRSTSGKHLKSLTFERQTGTLKIEQL